MPVAKSIINGICRTKKKVTTEIKPRIMEFRSKLFLSWVLSYVLISVFPVLIGSYVYVQSVKTIHYEVNRMETMSLQQLKSILDGKLDELDRTLSNISLNQDVKYLMSSPKPLKPKDILKIVNVQQDLSKFKLSNSNIEEIYIYLNNNDSIFSSVYKYNGSDIKNICSRELFLDYPEFNRLVNIKNYRYLRILKSTGTNGVDRKKVIIMQSLYLNNLSTPAGTLIISLDGDKIISLLKNLELTDSGEVILVNSKNEYYSTSSSRSLPDFLNYGYLKNLGITFYKTIDDKDTAVTHLPSDSLDLEYISLIPSKVFLSKVQYIKDIIYIYVCISLITGGIAAFFLAKRNFSPVAKLRQLLVHSLGRTENQETNEFAFLENSLKVLLDENRSIADNLKQQKTAQRNHFLSRLLRGRISNKEALKETLGTYEIEFDGECFLVTACSIEDPDQRLLDGNVEDEDAINMIYFAVKSIVEELLKEKYHAYIVEMDGMMVLIANAAEGLEPGQQVFQQDVFEILEKAIAFVQSRFEIKLWVFVSDVHYGLRGIRQAYSETLQVLEYKTLVGEKASIIQYGTIHNDLTNGFNDSYNLEKERLFANCIAAEDYRSAREILDDLLAKSINTDVKSIQLVKCRVFGLINITLDAIGEIRAGSDLDFFDHLDPANRLLNSKSIIDLKVQVDFIFDKIMEYYAERTRKQTPDWISRVEDYINIHYHEPDLSIASISQHIGISVSYLSRIYKKYQGIGMLDYIHKVRLERAKKMLESNRNIKDIALQVGYLESKALIRTFKKYEGITPGRYKETLSGSTRDS